jgi:hypothetical protein
MGCDYYICKDLYIYYLNENIPSLIELSREHGYFYYPNLDSDDEEYEKINNKYIREQLKPSMKPVTIYENGIFTSEYLEDKYKSLIQNELNNYKKKWEDIKIVQKKETRYERD